MRSVLAIFLLALAINAAPYNKCPVNTYPAAGESSLVIAATSSVPYGKHHSTSVYSTETSTVPASSTSTKSSTKSASSSSSTKSATESSTKSDASTSSSTKSTSSSSSSSTLTKSDSTSTTSTTPATTTTTTSTATSTATSTSTSSTTTTIPVGKTETSTSTSATATSSTTTSATPVPTPGASRNVVAYFVNWKPEYQVTDLPVEDLTHVIYAFAIPKNGVAVMTSAAIDAKQIPLLNDPTGPVRTRNPAIKSLMSIGGWSGSAEFSTIAKTAATRAAFIASVVKIVGDNGFDGADIDWEYPGTDGNAGNVIDAANDGANFTLLLAELRAALAKCQADKNRKHAYLVTVATGASANAYSKLDMAGLAANVDFVNVMTYDASGPWSPATAHNAPQSLIKAAMSGYIAAGLPASKLQFGIPLYARAFAGVKFGDATMAQIVGGGQAFNKALAAPGTAEPSVVDFNEIASAKYIGNKAYSKGYDRAENALTLWSAKDGVWISAEDATTAKAKSAFAVQQGLAGVFVWEASQDKSNAIVRAIKVALA
ncbi:glycosyl hydrolases family 18-domain-containing protein [Blastocladiella britannica]|nr:glycosyl hydrolases family 18-domain-containing protein [Blastocladiella britannica]